MKSKSKKIKLKVGIMEIENCTECPSFEWAGEDMYIGDHGFHCQFGAFKRVYDSMFDKSIPDNCPLMVFKI